MSKEYMDTQMPMRAPGSEDTDALEQDISERVDRTVDRLDEPVGHMGERGGMDIGIDDPDEGRGDVGIGREGDDLMGDAGDAVNRGVEDLREGIDDVSEQVRRTINGD